MKLEDQVCSFELAQELKELKVKQDTFFYWHQDLKKGKLPIIILGKGYEREGTTLEGENFSAFTVAELIEILPSGIRMCKGEGGFAVNEPTNPENKRCGFQAAKEPADALAKMLLYLLENKLI
jgi:hypothetical protein